MAESLDDTHVILPDLFATHARHDGSRPAIVCGDKTLSWGEFDAAMNRLANALLDLGLKKGDKVAMLLGNAVETPWVIYGAVRAGACVVPLSGMLTQMQIAGLVASKRS